METLKELKAIKCKRPLGATHHYFILLGEHKVSNYIDMDNCMWWDNTLCQWRDWGGGAETKIRSLSDINRIIELMEEVEKVRGLTVNEVIGKE